MATASRPKSASSGKVAPPILRTLWARSLRDIRVRTIAFAYLFAAVSYINPVSYRHAYPTLAERMSFAQSFAHNKAVVLFYGKAYDLLTVGGYAAWRSGGTLAILAAVFGLMAAVRLIRSNEESGQSELILSAHVSRRAAGLGVAAAICIATGLLWLAMFAAMGGAGLPLGGSAYLALSVVAMVPVFAALGALISQLASTRRLALELGLGVVAAFFLMRVIADTSGGVSWLRWLTPLGWSEQLRAFTGAAPVVMILPLALTALLTVVSARLQSARDIGTGLLRERDARPRLALLGSPTRYALRREGSSLIGWVVGIGLFALIIGVISRSVTSAGIPARVSNELAKLGAGSVLTPIGYISFTFIVMALVVSLFAASQIAAVRHEEEGGQLETLLGLPVGRGHWLGGRLAVALAAAVVLSLAAGVLTWVGAVSQGVSLSGWRMLEAGANCMPCAVLFLGIGAVAFAVVPRAASGVAYGLVIVAFVWQLFGSLLGAPHWLVDATPFVHLGLLPVHGFRAAPAAVMLCAGLASGAAATALFARRDVAGP